MSADRRLLHPAALDFVGLTPNILEQFDAVSEVERANKRAALLEELKGGSAVGAKLYPQIGNTRRTYDSPNHLALKIPVPGTGRNLEISAQETKRGFATSLMESWESEKQKEQPQEDDEVTAARHQYPLDIIEGYVSAAFDAKDWRTVVETYDFITEGGILNSQALKDKIEQLPLDWENHHDRQGIAAEITRLYADRDDVLRVKKDLELELSIRRIRGRGLFTSKEARDEAIQMVGKVAEIPEARQIIALKMPGHNAVIVILLDNTDLEKTVSILKNQFENDNENKIRVPNGEEPLTLSVQFSEFIEGQAITSNTKIIWNRIDQ